jgi:hypothetical protein
MRPVLHGWAASSTAVQQPAERSVGHRLQRQAARCEYLSTGHTTVQYTKWNAILLLFTHSVSLVVRAVPAEVRRDAPPRLPALSRAGAGCSAPHSPTSVQGGAVVWCVRLWGTESLPHRLTRAETVPDLVQAMDAVPQSHPARRAHPASAGNAKLGFSLEVGGSRGWVDVRQWHRFGDLRMVRVISTCGTVTCAEIYKDAVLASTAMPRCSKHDLMAAAVAVVLLSTHIAQGSEFIHTIRNTSL